MESRLQGLLQYLSLLNEMDNGSLPFSMYEQKKVVCREIEKELGVLPGKFEVRANKLAVTTEETARIIADKIRELGNKSL